jgi:DGQHR domain-containing protein
MEARKMKEDPISVKFPCIRVQQPIGVFYIAAINSKQLYGMTWADVRRIESEKRDIETYLGVQRPLSKNRVDELKKYVRTTDACFPTAVILAIPGICASFDEETSQMTVSNYLDEVNPENNIIFGKVAKVLDGQHRIEGLRDYDGDTFDINVSIFVDIDIAEQAYIFSTVNLAQTKVNKSLVYDLYDYAKSRSPQKLCHNIAVALDANEKSPLYRRIKRLGVATEGRFNETITQATFVESLMRYVTKSKSTAMADRDTYMKGRVPQRASQNESRELIFRNMMIDERDMEIADVVWNYFTAVKERWPVAWASTGQGIMLNKTNGFRALMRLLRDAYMYLTSPGNVPSSNDFLDLLSRIDMNDGDFVVEKYKPGTSGESALYHDLVSMSPIESLKAQRNLW